MHAWETTRYSIRFKGHSHSIRNTRQARELSRITAVCSSPQCRADRRASQAPTCVVSLRSRRPLPAGTPCPFACLLESETPCSVVGTDACHLPESSLSHSETLRADVLNRRSLDLGRRRVPNPELSPSQREIRPPERGKGHRPAARAGSAEPTGACRLAQSRHCS